MSLKKELKNIESLYLRINKDRIYFEDLYTKDGYKILYIEKELRLCPIDVNINNKVFDISNITEDDIKIICTQLNIMIKGH